jgi:hypothetical protein
MIFCQSALLASRKNKKEAWGKRTRVGEKGDIERQNKESLWQVGKMESRRGRGGGDWQSVTDFSAH